jgi:hypothetical protein
MQCHPARSYLAADVDPVKAKQRHSVAAPAQRKHDLRAQPLGAQSEMELAYAGTQVKALPIS